MLKTVNGIVTELTAITENISPKPVPSTAFMGGYSNAVSKSTNVGMIRRNSNVDKDRFTKSTKTHAGTVLPICIRDASGNTTPVITEIRNRNCRLSDSSRCLLNAF